MSILWYMCYKERIDSLQEEWKYIEGYEKKYQISNMGRLRSLYFKDKYGNKWDKIYYLKWSLNRKGYQRTRLCLNGKLNSSVFAHRLVADAFIPNPQNLPQVNHKDGNKKNNRVDNLEWCSNKENALHSQKNGLNPSLKRFSENFNAIPVEKYSLDGEYIETFGSLIEAAMSCKLKSTGRITNACRDWNKTSGGYKWKYKKNK